MQAGESEAEELGTEVMGGAGWSGMQVRGAGWGVEPPGEMAGNGVQHPLEVGRGVEWEVGGGEVTGVWGRYWYADARGEDRAWAQVHVRELG